ncbi:GMC family oxidoreductase N-terminal domain-containing protein [Flavitalea sp. BT771]|uniref:GMC family oxidoreductase N-terminal domain-containing protein n=1 Tax=Flavitalea sp. BT771 TaxID=3063329 RepID=UPI0026E3EE2F|nr:GMC family oxidoreductase N-terminal domain-containing protein [Flavitalea sp. BT771]MDO6433665.1 GMC family oxidoreductase N-terminal domain-containing protein [Flavitalea sp. BT771]MDV6222430.1 GMC family oxidoreductase N-terminal domain-containing protein [Flavitalea sp. BT771]
MNPSLVLAEKRLRTILKLLLLLSLLILFFHVFPKWTPGFLEGFAFHGFSLLANHSFPQGAVLTLLLAMVIGDIRRFSVLLRLLIGFLVIGVTWSIVNWIRAMDPHAGDMPYWAKTAVYAVMLVILWVLFGAAGRARYALKYLSVRQFQTLEALAEVCIAGDSRSELLAILPVEVAMNVDNYLWKFKARSKWVMKVVLTCMEFYPLLSLHVPLSQMLPDDRLKFLKKRFLTAPQYRMLPDWYVQLTQAAIRMSKQLCYMGYYSDKRVHEGIGYTPFSGRKDIKERFAEFPTNHSQSASLRVMTESDIATSEITADVVIVGSGAGASILAHQLVGLGRKVLMVERGQLELPSTFNDNEVDMVSRLYADGALQLSRDFRFQVFQGSCVGGSTVVNNAVCFETPDYILDKWINEMGIGLDRSRYEQSMKEVYSLMHVAHTPTMTSEKYLNPGGSLFSAACAKMGFGKPQLDSVMANIDGCVGCGYCNIGCQFGKKLSMLDTVLPQTQQSHPDKLQILAGCEGVSFNKKGSRIVSLTGQFKSGRKVTIKGNTFVSSAGAISSSILLIKSKLGIANAGKKLAFNLGSQITAAFRQRVNSYDGLQISHFLKTGDRRFVMETWYNPPMFQSTAMPGWFDQHFHNMYEYGNMACTGVLVGTSSNAEVKAAGLLGRDINYVPTEDDFDSLMEALEKAAEIYLTGGGAVRVMPNTFSYYEYKTVEELKENLRKDVKSSRDISTGTGHPQGGNVMSNDPATGVVDEGFKVFGFDNLFVCDASVFPTSLGVNPQVTVMALAHYAAPMIARNV